MNRLFRSQAAATSQTQWVAFTYPALIPRQDLWQIPFMAAAQGAVPHFHSLGAVCFDITSLPFPLIWDSASGRAHKSQGCLSEQISWKHTLHQDSALTGTKSTMARAWPTPHSSLGGKQSVRKDLVCLLWTAQGRQMLMLTSPCILLWACFDSVQLHTCEK